MYLKVHLGEFMFPTGKILFPNWEKSFTQLRRKTPLRGLLAGMPFWHGSGDFDKRDAPPWFPGSISSAFLIPYYIYRAD